MRLGGAMMRVKGHDDMCLASRWLLAPLRKARVTLASSRNGPIWQFFLLYPLPHRAQVRVSGITISRS